MQPSPAARRRFAFWVAVVVAWLVGLPAWLWLFRGGRIPQAHLTLPLGWALLGLPPIATAVLLATTPADAIRLRPRVGAAAVLLGAVWLHVWAAAPLAPRPLVWPCVVVVLATAGLVAALLAVGRSPWHATLFGWHPLVVVIATGGVADVGVLGTSLMIGSLLVAAIAVCVFPAPGRSGGRGRTSLPRRLRAPRAGGDRRL